MILEGLWSHSKSLATAVNYDLTFPSASLSAVHSTNQHLFQGYTNSTIKGTEKKKRTEKSPETFSLPFKPPPKTQGRKYSPVPISLKTLHSSLIPSSPSLLSSPPPEKLPSYPTSVSPVVISGHVSWSRSGVMASRQLVLFKPCELYMLTC